MVYLSETNAPLCCLSLSSLFSISGKKKPILFPLQSVCSPAAEVNSVKRITAGGVAGLIAHTDLFVL